MDDITLPEFPLSKIGGQQSGDSLDDDVFIPVKRIKTETLLDEKGNWNLVEKSELLILCKRTWLRVNK